MRLIKYLTVTILPLMWIFFIIPESHSAKIEVEGIDYQTTNLDRLKKAFQSKDRLTMIHELELSRAPSSNSKENSIFIEEVWEKKKSKYPNLSWNLISDNYVQVTLANTLLQAERNKRLVIQDRQGIVDYLTSLLENNDIRVVREAVQTIYLTEDIGVINKLYELANNPMGEMFSAYIHGLSLMCRSEASDALLKLESKINDEKKKKQVQETLKFRKEMMRKGFCHEVN